MSLFIILSFVFALAWLLGKPVTIPGIWALKYSNTSGDTYKGTLDQRTYTLWKGIKVVKAKVSHMTNPQSTRQNLVRGYVEQFAKAWDALSAADKAQWEQLAGIVPQPNPEAGIRAIIRRPTTAMSGINAFIGYNVRAAVLGNATQIDRPAVHNPVMANTGYAISWSPAGTLKVDWTDANAGTATCYVNVWATFTNKGLAHRQLLGSALSSAETVNITTCEGALGVSQTLADLAGARMYIQCEAVDQATGNFSVPSNTFETVAA